MATEILVGSEPASVRRAAAILKEGDLVAFPTETVYGLGADATRAEAVLKIFEAKGRPANNPLIVHVLDEAQAETCVTGFDGDARRLAARFWPGPLTLVLPRAERIPLVVSASGSTLAIRSPDHSVARALLLELGRPLAAPSANRSNHVSPTTAEHVRDDLLGRVALILDGGPCRVGLESTVLDLSRQPPVILRPGAVGADALAEVLGSRPSFLMSGESHAGGVERSPGRGDVHYAPRVPLRWLDVPREAVPAGRALRGTDDVQSSRGPPPSPVVWILREGFDVSAIETGSKMLIRWLPADPEGYAQKLYAALRQAEDGGAMEIWVGGIPDNPAWEAVRDRLARAASTPADPP